MTLFQAVAAVTKVQIKSDFRRVVRDALTSVRTSTSGGSGAPLDQTLDYFARQLRLQFRGYLLLQGTEVGRPGATIPVPTLTAEQWLQLSRGDLFIRTIDAGLLEAIGREIGPEVAAVCDPYHGFKEGPHHPDVNRSERPIPEVDVAVSSLAEHYVKHPSLQVLKANRRLLEELQPIKLSALSSLVRSIMDETPGRPTDEDLAIFRGESILAGAVDKNIGPAGACIYALQKSLSVMNGLLFDAFEVDRLVVMSEENCFSVSQGLDRLGRRAKISLQPEGRELHRNSGDVVFIALPADGYSGLSGPAYIEKETFSMSREVGMTATFEVRPLDDWLNPYPGASTR
jgi:hypothetical protein